MKYKPYVCNVTNSCSTRYYRKYQLLRHIASKHKHIKLSQVSEQAFIENPDQFQNTTVARKNVEYTGAGERGHNTNGLM